MRKRMQVRLEDDEYRRLQRIAKRHHMLAEWVGQALRTASREEPDGELVREDARHGYPSADIGRMLGGIEAGYSRDLRE